MTYNDARKIALAFKDVEEGTSYGTPALKVNGVLFVRFRPELESIVIKSTIEVRDEMIAEEPETYYITDHYKNYPWVLVRLSRISSDVLRDLLWGAWRLASKEKKKRSK